MLEEKRNCPRGFYLAYFFLATALKLRVLPDQTHKWRQNITTDEVLPAKPCPHTGVELSIIEDYKCLKTRSRGRRALRLVHLIDPLLPFLEESNERGYAASPMTLTIE
jgi:hypothetical protein